MVVPSKSRTDKLYAQHAWRVDDMRATWAHLERTALRDGYPTLALYQDGRDPYDAVRKARAADEPFAPLVVQS